MAQPDIMGLLGTAAPHADLTPPPPEAPPGPAISDEELKALWKDIKLECFESSHVFERQWMRNLYYVLYRQWIEYQARYGGWRDKRMAQWMPRPVTNKCKETVQTIRAMFATINLGVNVRPNGNDPKNVSAAATADELAPLLYEAHDLDHVFSEFDFWLCVTGNAFLHTFLDYDAQNGFIVTKGMECAACGWAGSETDLNPMTPACPECGGPVAQAMDPLTGQPSETRKVKGAVSTICLSPLEISFPMSYARFKDLPYVVRKRWRTKTYFERHPDLKALVNTLPWQKAPDNPSLQLFKSLSTHNDLGIASGYFDSLQAESQIEGMPEYEVHMKPTEKYPEGLVFRVYGDKDPTFAHLEATEAIPGPLPYKDADGNPLFTFTHAGFEHVGGRLIASSAIDSIIHKQDQLNQLDSMILLIIQRMSNPVWLEPKGAEIERLTGMPGLVVKYNPLTVGGNAKPERIPGEGPHPSLFQIREQYLKDIEELSGTFDILKGAKPAGVEAFSAMQLLVERSQARFASVFKSRGKAFRDWFGFAIELEREFGPDERTKAILNPNRSWTFQNFKRAQLQGSFSIVVEDGSTVPKTNLGMRAALEHAKALGMLDMINPDEKYEGLKLFGLTRMVPSLDYHVQASLQKQQAFEEWIKDPAAVQQAMMQGMQKLQAFAQEQEQAIQQQAAAPPPPAGPNGEPGMPAMPAPIQVGKAPSILDGTPLKWLPWYDPFVHRQEFVKWANSDRVRELLADPKTAMVEPLLAEALQVMDMEIMNKAMQQMAMTGGPAGGPPKPGGAPGAGQSMNNSNRESTSGNEPNGPGQPKA